MVKQIIQIGSPLLLQESKAIPKSKILSREIQDLIQDMLDTCDSEKDDTAGLSAVQIGKLSRVYVVRRVDIEENSENPIWQVMINPQVKLVGKAESSLWEGCLSIGVGPTRPFGPVRRVDRVEVDYLDPEGKPQHLVAKDFLAHIIQHEQDHLNGVLFLKYVKNPDNLWTSADLDAYLERYDAYPPIKP